MIRMLETVAIACGERVLALRNEAMETRDKAEQLGQHFSTRADRESQDIGISLLAGAWPNGIVVAEGKCVSHIPWHSALDKTQLAADVGSWTLRYETFDLVLRPLAARFNILNMMSAVEGGRRVLMGQIGAYWNFGIAKIWDAVAMALATTEAGGVAYDPTGGPIQWNRVDCDWIVAGNQTLADIVLEYSRNWQGRQ